jgi:phosphoribosylformylglycinamidine synthase subunit PurL
MTQLLATPELAAEHGLSAEEYARIVQLLNRTPNLTELGIFSVMWSEHCSYKSTRVWLKTLPTTGPQVICGPGENAGVVDIGDGDAVIFKMESHNHPSFIEPYQGAATGVGGIMRDVFTMGARPVAMLNALRFGEPEHPKTRHLISGVVSGIGGYGNCMGVPTVAGEVNFDKSYNGNILVNAMCVGLARADNIFYSAASAVGAPVVYVGSKTGRDGIHGATMASAEFDDASEEKRPTVQVGDPFTEKLLLEACLELMATDAILSIQDMGAAGLTSSSSEMASKGGNGIELDLDHVPQREEGMTAYEMMLSESQERMLMVLKPGKEALAKAVFDKWGLDFAVIGRVTGTKRLVVKHKGAVEADLPVNALADEAPLYERPWVETPKRPVLRAEDVSAPDNYTAAILTMLALPDMASRRWIWEQYDHTVMGDTVQGPGGDAAIVRVHGTKKALAVCTDVTPRYVFADPVEGGKQAVAETWRNITAVGGTPLAYTDNMNFAAPTRPEIMGQFVGAVKGLTAAGLALGYPVIGGNCSLYNETNGQGILPTPAIGGVGLLKDASKNACIGFREWGGQIVLIGGAPGWLGASIYARDIAKIVGVYAPPPVDLAAEKRNGDFVRGLIESGTVTVCHDLSDGGLLAALAEMCLAAAEGGIGAQIDLAEGVPPHAFLFGEDQARYLIVVDEAALSGVLSSAAKAGVPAERLGVAGGKHLRVGDLVWASLDEMRSSHEGFFPGLMAAPVN